MLYQNSQSGLNLNNENGGKNSLSFVRVEFEITRMNFLYMLNFYDSRKIIYGENDLLYNDTIISIILFNVSEFEISI